LSHSGRIRPAPDGKWIGPHPWSGPLRRASGPSLTLRQPSVVRRWVVIQLFGQSVSQAVRQAGSQSVSQSTMLSHALCFLPPWFPAFREREGGKRGREMVLARAVTNAISTPILSTGYASVSSCKTRPRFPAAEPFPTRFFCCRASTDSSR
jgi:hypothetical protein